jgi:hypothetical protein
MTINHLIRWSTVLAVLMVAGVAGTVSYLHALAVVSAHGETGPVARMYPGTIDGLIYAASMVLLDSARRGVTAPALARWLLGAGIAVTVAVNVLDGTAHGALGAVVAAWPAVALVGSYELLMMLIRGSVHPKPGAAGDGDDDMPPDDDGTAPDPLLIAADTAFPDVITGAPVPSLRSIRRTLRVGDARARRVRDHLDRTRATAGSSS